MDLLDREHFSLTKPVELVTSRQNPPLRLFFFFNEKAFRKYFKVMYDLMLRI